MPNTYTTTSGVTLSRDAFIAHYVAAYMAVNPDWNWKAPDSPVWFHPSPAKRALDCAEAAWGQLEALNP